MEAYGLQLLHYAPGRARLKIKALRGHRELCGRLQTELESVPGMTAVEVNPLTGSVLVHFVEEIMAEPPSIATLKDTLRRVFPDIDLAALERRLRSELS